jgi:hypothetical protein
MSAATAAACKTQRIAAFQKLAPIRAKLVEKLSKGAFSSKEQKEWELMPAYLRDLAMVMAGVEERQADWSLLAFTQAERQAIMQVLALLKRDMRAVVVLALSVRSE